MKPTTKSPDSSTKSELLESQMNVEAELGNKEGSTELVQYEDVPNSPFKIVTLEGAGHFISIGNNRVSEFEKDKEELYKKLNRKDWDIITTLLIYLIKNQSKL